MMKKVLVAGKFDILHPGHLRFFELAKSKGNRLVVVVARDETIKKKQGKYPVYNENLRKQFLEALTITDKVVLGKLGDEMQILLDLKPEIICLGYDQEITEKRIKEFIKKNELKITMYRLPAFKDELFKSSRIKKQVNMKQMEVKLEKEQIKSKAPRNKDSKNKKNIVNKFTFVKEIKNKKELDKVPIFQYDYDEIEDWEKDKKGYFLIRINKKESLLELAYCKKIGVIEKIFVGHKPQDVYFQLHKQKLISRVDHASYVGKELEKAYLALKYNLDYVQDKELNLKGKLKQKIKKK